MNLFKYFIGSLIISFGMLLVIAIVLMAVGFELPEGATQYLLMVWGGLAVVLLPLAKKIIRI